MAAWHFVGAPGGIGFDLGVVLFEIGIVVALGPDVGLSWHAIARTGQPNGGEGDADRLSRKLLVDPGLILLVDLPDRRRWCRPGDLGSLCRLFNFGAAARRIGVQHPLSVFRHERIEEDDRRYLSLHPLSNSGYDPSAVGMTDQYKVLEILPTNDIDDVGDVGVERDETAHEVRALPEPGQCGRVDFVTGLLEKIGDPAIAPPTGR